MQASFEPPQANDGVTLSDLTLSLPPVRFHRRFPSFPFQDQGLQHARLVFQFYFVGAMAPTVGAPNPLYDANGCASK